MSHPAKSGPFPRDLTATNARTNRRERNRARRDWWAARKRQLVPHTPRLTRSEHTFDLAFVAVTMFLLGMVTAVSLMTAR